jgi:hypothetical protein
MVVTSYIHPSAENMSGTETGKFLGGILQSFKTKLMKNYIIVFHVLSNFCN